MKVFFCINIFVSNFSMILLKTIVSFLYRKFTFTPRGLNLNLNRLYISIMVSRYVLFLLIFYLVKKIKYNNTIKIKSVVFLLPIDVESLYGKCYMELFRFMSVKGLSSIHG